MHRISLKRLNIVIALIGLLSSIFGTLTSVTPASAHTDMSAISTETASLDSTGPDIVVEPAEYSYIEDSMQTSSDVPAFETGMSNPAATYCKELGYEYTKGTDPFGQEYSTCQIDAKTLCPAWDFLNGTCGTEFNACAIDGLPTIVREDGRSAYGQVYAECVNPQTGTFVKATDLVDMHITTSYKVPESLENQMAEPSDSIQATLPSSFDWRDVDGQNWLTPVRDQGNCGSCWAFAAVGVVEANANIDNDNSKLDLDLAEQALVSDCCATCGNCTSGNHTQALYKIKNDGIADEGCFPYEGSDCGCEGACSDMDDRLHYVDSVNYIGSNPNYNTIKQALIDHGPMVGPLLHDGSGSWNGDIFSCGSSTSFNHSVVLVGWDDSDSTWIIRNSWGQGWNDGGYYKVAYGTCSVERYLYYVDSDPQYSDINVTNEGSETLTVTDVQVENNACWLDVELDGSLPTSISTGDSFGFDLSFDKSCVDYGTYTDALLIYSNDSTENPKRIPVTFTKPDGAVGADLTATHGGLTNDPIIAGQEVTWSIDVSNIGNQDVEISTRLRLKTASSCGAAATAVGSASTPPVAVGATETVEYAFTANNLGTIALIAVADNAGETNDYDQSNNTLCIEREVVESATCYSLDTGTSGNGSVDISPAPNCGSDYTAGTIVTLTADADSGWSFDSWSGSTSGTSNPVNVTMNGNKSVNASFSEIPPTCYSLDIGTSGNGSVDISPAPNCGSDYEDGTVVTLTADADSGWSFDSWSGSISGTSNPVNVTMNGNKSVNASFSEIPPTCYSLDTGTSGNGSVDVSPAPNCGSDYEDGTVVTLTADPDSDWTFENWSGALTGTANPSTITVHANTNITANFSEVPVVCYDLNLGSAGSGEVVVDTDPNCGNQYIEGTALTLTAVPNDNWRFDGWNVDADGDDNPLLITMDEDTTITAQFSAVDDDDLASQCVALTTSSTGNGIVQAWPAPDCADGTSYTKGTEVTLVAQADSGASFARWTGDASGSVNPLLVTLNSSVEVIADFESTTLFYSVLMPVVMMQN